MIDLYHAATYNGHKLTMFLEETLAHKAGRLVPTDFRGRAEVTQWLFWQVGGLGPMAGQVGHFKVYAPEKLPYAIERYTKETNRLYGVLDRRLAGREFIVGDYSIADVACYPWIVPHAAHGQRLDDFPNLARWFAAISERPATKRVYESAPQTYSAAAGALSDEERRILFGQTAASVSARGDTKPER